jgi:hypothetical protein
MRRRHWLILAGLLLVAGGVALVLNGPRLACAWLRGQAPLMTDDGSLVVTGAAVAAGPPAAVVVTVAPERLHQVVDGAAAAWLPGFLFGPGQSVWGEIPPAEHAWWRVDTAPSASLTVIARLSHREANALAAHLAGEAATRIAVERFALDTLPPGPDGVRRYAIAAAGSLMVRWGGGLFTADLAIPIRQLDAVVELRPDGQRLTAHVTLTTLDAEVPLLGASLRGIAERELNRFLARSLDGLVLPPWIPWEAQVTVRAGSAGTTEL